jgi:hypothetical protein
MARLRMRVVRSDDGLPGPTGGQSLLRDRSRIPRASSPVIFPMAVAAEYL